MPAPEPPARPPSLTRPRGWGRAARSAGSDSAMSLTPPSPATERGSAEPRSATMRARRGPRGLFSK
eukprot:3941552-Alexandrium_andersonii.AAC.1